MSEFSGHLGRYLARIDAAGGADSAPAFRPHEPDPQAPHQVLRLPDERLRFPSHGGHAGAARVLSRPRSADDADLVILNTCHIREKAAEKVYSELGRLREMKEKPRATAAT